METNVIKYGIAHLAIIPMRKEASETSEMVSQLLFGEVYLVHSIEEKWVHITSYHDSYHGYISKNQFCEIEAHQFNNLAHQQGFVASEPVNKLLLPEGNTQWIPIGSTLPFFKDTLVQIQQHQFPFVGKAIQIHGSTIPNIKEIAEKFLHTPYLWGGRSIFGIDCSGFSQLVYKFFGIQLPRDAYQQAELGETVDFLTSSAVGDLAFFDNEEGKIIHVGIIIDKNKIIHASGTVRIDAVDHQGIFNSELKKYTHKLRIVKRLIPALNTSNG